MKKTPSNRRSKATTAERSGTRKKTAVRKQRAAAKAHAKSGKKPSKTAALLTLLALVVAAVAVVVGRRLSRSRFGGLAWMRRETGCDECDCRFDVPIGFRPVRLRWRDFLWEPFAIVAIETPSATVRLPACIARLNRPTHSGSRYPACAPSPNNNSE